MVRPYYRAETIIGPYFGSKVKQHAGVCHYKEAGRSGSGEGAADVGGYGPEVAEGDDGDDEDAYGD